MFDDLVWGSAPISADDRGTVGQDGRLEVGGNGVLGNDRDPDGDPLAAVLVRQPANGSVILRSNGSYAYTPNRGFSGNDTFVYRASDGTGRGNDATVRIRVDPSPPPPPPPPPPPAPPLLKDLAVQLTFGFLPLHPKKTTRFIDFVAHNVPKGSKLVGRCLGKKCRGKLGKKFTIANTTKTNVKLKRFLKKYPAGTSLELTVSKSGFNNQIKITAIRRNKIPSVVATKCQAPGSKTRRNC